MIRTTRTRRSAEQWRALIAGQVASGMGQEAFCKHKQLALSTFAYWKRRLAFASDERSECSEPTPDSLNWIDLGRLGLGAGTGSGWLIELDLGNGVCLRVSRG